VDAHADVAQIHPTTELFGFSAECDARLCDATCLYLPFPENALANPTSRTLGKRHSF
jgi:hypothetical protein